MRRPAAVLLLSAAVPALIVVPTIGQGAADPHPVAPRLSTVALGGVDPQAWAAEQAHPAPAEAGAEHDAGDPPEILTAPMATAAYSLLGVTWDGVQPTPVTPEGLRVTVRTRSHGTWAPWTTLTTDSGDRPAEGEGVVPVQGAEPGVGTPARVGSSPYFAGPSDGVQVRVDTVAGPLPVGLRVDLVDPGRSDADGRLVATAPSAAHAAAGKPAVISRSQWGADETLRNGGPTYEPKISVIFVHHTATSNSYTKDQAAAAIRSIYAYDTNSLGWSDIAYNVLVDKFGQVFEGRYGGLDKAVRSGATGGFNAQSWAVSAVGDYSTEAPSASMITSLSRVLAWKAGINHLDPAGTASLTAANGSGTTAKYPDGTTVSFNVISGHRDAGSTACPGTRLYALLPTVRASVAQLMGAALYKTTASPLVVAKGGTTPIRVRATAMNQQDWRLEVRKQGTTTVLRTFSGNAVKGGAIDVSWDLKDAAGKTVVPGVYTLTVQSWTATTAAVPYAVNVSLFADPDVFERPADGIFHLEGRGYGHGHGMSQFGAEGAARKGLTRDQILSFYYPGTSVATASTSTTMRVSLDQGVRTLSGDQDIRLRPASGLLVSDGTRTLVLPTTLGGGSVTVWRVLRSGDSLSLYGRVGSSYVAVSGWTSRPGVFRFTTAPGASTTSRVTVIRPSGEEIVYRGVVEARRSTSSGVLVAVSEVLLDDYVKSVVSAEMPGGWTDTAYQAQAVAARSYAMFKRSAAGAAGSAWHICDTTACQVYNGYSGETSPESKAATATARQYLTYGGAPIFAEFSSANGGWTSTGSKPYLVAKADPYDGVVTGTANWGHAWTKDIAASTIQTAYPTVGTIERIVVIDRVNHGEWGGRVVSVRLEGSKADVTVSGTELRSALALKSEWFRAQQVPPAPPPVVVPTSTPPPVGPTPSTVQTARATGGDRSARLSWAAPATTGGAITGYRVTESPGGRIIEVPSTTRTIIVDDLVNGRAYSFAVVARNSAGFSKPVSVGVTPASAFGYLVTLPAATLWSGPLEAATDRVVSVLGTAGLPTTNVASVTLRVTASSAGGRGGVLKVGATGSSVGISQVQVPAGGTASNLLIVRTGTGGALTLRASASMSVSVEVVGYDTRLGTVGQRLIPVQPTWVGSGIVNAKVPLSVTVAGKAGIRAGTHAVLLQATVSSGVTPTTVRLSPDGTEESAVQVVTVPAHGTRTVPVVVPLASDGTVRVLSSGLGASVSLDVQGFYVTDDGIAPGGRTRSITPSRLFDSRGSDLARPAPVAGSTLTVPVLGRNGVPATGVSAVILNVIAYNPTTTGGLTIFPTGATRPSTRALSYDAGGGVRTTVVARVGAAGSIQVYVPSGGVHVVIDVSGYVTG